MSQIRGNQISGSVATASYIDPLFISSSAAAAGFGSGGGGGTGAGFPFSGNAIISGSLLVTGSGLNVSGPTNLSGSLTVSGSPVLLGPGSTSYLKLTGGGSYIAPALNIWGPQNGAISDPSIALHNNTTDIISSRVYFLRSNANSQLTTADIDLGELQFYGAGNSTPAFVQGASIKVTTTHPTTTTSSPAKIAFSTTPSGSITPVERMVLDETGSLRLNKPLYLNSDVSVVGSPKYAFANSQSLNTGMFYYEPDKMIFDAGGQNILKLFPTSIDINTITRFGSQYHSSIEYTSTTAGAGENLVIKAGINTITSRTGSVYISQGGLVVGSTTFPTGSNRLSVSGSSNFAGNMLITGSLRVSGSTLTNNLAEFGTIGIQPYTVNNAWFGDNVYYNGTQFIRRVAGYTGLFYFQGREGQFRFGSSAGAGTVVTDGVDGYGAVSLKTNLNGTFAVGNIAPYTDTYTGARFIVDSSGNVGINIISPSYKLHVVEGSIPRVAQFQQSTANRSLDIAISSQNLGTEAIEANQGSIGIGNNRLMIKYGPDNPQWGDAVYRQGQSDIDLNQASKTITYPGAYQIVTPGAEVIRLPAADAWAIGTKVIITNATDEPANVATDGGTNGYLEGTTQNPGIVSPRSTVEYVTNGQDWRMMPSLTQPTFDGLDVSPALSPVDLFSKGAYQFNAAGGSDIVFYPANRYVGQTITIINNDNSNSISISQNGSEPRDETNTGMTSLSKNSVHQFISIGGMWRLISKIAV